MSQRHFPPELVSKVVQHAYDARDGDTLNNASLACQQWWVIAQPYVFRRVDLVSEQRLERFRKLLGESPSIASYVQILVIRPELTYEALKPSAWIVAAVHSLASVLTNLTSVELLDIYDLGKLCTAEVMRQFSQFATVHTLTLCNSQLPLPAIYALVSALPALQTFILSALPPFTVTGASDLPRLHSPRLKALDLGSLYPYPVIIDDVLTWLLSTPTRETVRSLKVDMRLQDSLALKRFIESVGPQLEHLDLQLEISSRIPAESEVLKQRISLKGCTSLKTLTVHDIENPTSELVCAFLAEVTSTHIHTITLPVLLGGDTSALPSFAHFAAPFSKAPLTGLQCLRVVYQGLLSCDEVMQKLQHDLPRVHSRGIIKVVS